MIEDYTSTETCKCCHGSGVQRNEKTGLRQPCPYCEGTGKVKRYRRSY